MKERPILFSAPMVRALLAGTKTQTRRLVKPQPISNAFGPPDPVHDIPCHCDSYPPSAMLWPDENGGMLNADAGHPWFDVDRLWVKETFCAPGAFGVNGRKLFAANPEDDAKRPRDELGKPFHWKPSIFMPRVASRITLEITAVRSERLHAITEADAIAEGIEQRESCAWNNYHFHSAHPKRGVTVTDEQHRIRGYVDPRNSYRSLWQSINGAGSWDANPWVWVIEFKRILP